MALGGGTLDSFEYIYIYMCNINFIANTRGRAGPTPTYGIEKLLRVPACPSREPP